MANVQNTSNESFVLELVSPEAVISSDPVTLAILPASQGPLGVMAGHTPLLTALQPGVIEMHMAATKDVRKIFVSGGFLDISAEKVTALAVTAKDVSEIDSDDAKTRYDTFSAELPSASNDNDRLALEEKILIARAEYQAVTGKILA